MNHDLCSWIHRDQKRSVYEVLLHFEAVIGQSLFFIYSRRAPRNTLCIPAAWNAMTFFRSLAIRSSVRLKHCSRVLVDTKSNKNEALDIS